MKFSVSLLTAVALAAVSGIRCEASGEGTFFLDWRVPALEIAGTAKVTAGGSGNAVRWQHEANLAALKRVEEEFVRAMTFLRVDAYNSARTVLLREQHRNEGLYRYIAGRKSREVSYGEGSVTVASSFPLFGRDGFGPLLVSAGLDPGSFPVYEEYVFSAAFSGLVVDARGLGRVPAIAPRILDEDHRVVFSTDFVKPESFALHGAVQYTSDPRLRGLEDRVGNNPLRVVALLDGKTIETDVTIGTLEAKILLQDPVSRESLAQGKVVIVIDGGVIVQPRDSRF